MKRVELHRGQALARKSGLDRKQAARRKAALASNEKQRNDKLASSIAIESQAGHMSKSRPGSTSRKSGISPASPAQRRKVAGQRCLVCGASPCDPAHVIPRSAGGCNEPDCVVPICRDCHDAQHNGKLDLLSYLEPDHRAEQAHAVLHVGIEGARLRTAPSAYREEAA